jgi:hypothetical protein
LEGIVKLAFVSKFAVKFIEVAGAGLASALCAYLLGHIERPPAPAPAPAVVYLSPTAADTLREDHARLATIARPEAENQAEAVATPPMASAPKVAKSASVGVARRNQKSEQGSSAARTGEPLALQPPTVAFNSASRPAGASVQTPADRDEPAGWNNDEERPIFARLRQIPSWFLPENDRIFGDLPRPPMPVGDSLRSAM